MGYNGIPQIDFVHYLVIFNIEQPIILAYVSKCTCIDIPYLACSQEETVFFVMSVSCSFVINCLEGLLVTLYCWYKHGIL